MKLKLHHRYWIIILVSLAATVWSLYYSYYGDPFTNVTSGELFNRANWLLACDLCRWMRIFQYPIVIISGVALWTKDRNAAWRYILPMAVLGLIVTVYKQFLEWGIIEEASATICTSPTISCSTPQVEYFGRLGLPTFGLIAFLIIIFASSMIYFRTHDA